MTLLGKILAILNVVAAALFAYLALLDHGKRQIWAHAVALHDRAIDGLAIEEQQRELSILKDPKNSSSFFAAVNKAANKTVADASGKVEILTNVLTPLAVDYKQLEDYQKRIKEVRDNPKKLNALLEEAAKRSMLAQALLPLEEFRYMAHRELLAKTIADLKMPYDKLEKMLIERIDELLRPQAEDEIAEKGKKDQPSGIVLELITVKDPGYHIRYQRIPQDQKVRIWFEDTTGAKKEASVSPSQVFVKLSNVDGEPRIELTREGTAFSKKDEAFKADRILRGEISFTVSGKPNYVWFAERESVDYRQALAYMLITLNRVAAPGGTFLGVPTEQRTEEVVGRKMFIDALGMQTVAYQQIAERRQAEIEHDFDHFVEQYHLMIKERLPYLKRFIARLGDDLQRLKEDLAGHEKHYDKRKDYRDSIAKQLKEERKKATAALKELAKWQHRLFLIQKKGSGVSEENQRLEQKIRKLELGR